MPGRDLAPGRGDGHRRAGRGRRARRRRRAPDPHRADRPGGRHPRGGLRGASAASSPTCRPTSGRDPSGHRGGAARGDRGRPLDRGAGPPQADPRLRRPPPGGEAGRRGQCLRAAPRHGPGVVHLLRPHRRLAGGRAGQQPDVLGRRARSRRLREGHPHAGAVRRLPDPRGLPPGRARLPGGPPGGARPHPLPGHPLPRGALRVHRPDADRRGAQGVRPGVAVDERPPPDGRRALRLARCRDRLHGPRGRRQRAVRRSHVGGGQADPGGRAAARRPPPTTPPGS